MQHSLMTLLNLGHLDSSFSLRFIDCVHYSSSYKIISRRYYFWPAQICNWTIFYQYALGNCKPGWCTAEAVAGIWGMLHCYDLLCMPESVLYWSEYTKCKYDELKNETWKRLMILVIRRLIQGRFMVHTHWYSLLTLKETLFSCSYSTHRVNRF